MFIMSTFTANYIGDVIVWDMWQSTATCPHGTDLVQLPVYFAGLELVEKAPELERVDGHDLRASPLPTVPGRRGSQT